MEQYAEIVGDEASEDEYLAIADYFVTAKRMFNAGKFFLKAGQYAKVQNTGSCSAFSICYCGVCL